MKSGIQRNICIALLSCCAVGVIAQDDIVKTVKRMITSYPDARHRVEFRYDMSDDGQSFQEIRFDFHIPKDSIKPTDYTALLKSYEEAWRSASPQTDRMQQYAYRDSICSTIVYGSANDNQENLLQRNNIVRFRGGPGYLLFDVGKDISITVDRIEFTDRLPQSPEFNDIENTVKAMCRGHKVTQRSVRYTGYKGSFEFQRGKGRGWTRGTRYSIEGCTQADFDHLRNVFMSRYGGKESVNLIAYNDKIIVKNEKGPEFFIASFRNGNTINFLSASAENEICIPLDWENIDCFNNGKRNYIDLSRLDSIYDTLSRRKDIGATAVQYSGGWTKKIKGFLFQRNWGVGWTRGNRLIISDLSPQEKNGILETFKSYKDVLGYLPVNGNRAYAYENGTRTFYGFELDENGNAYMLRATTDGEICIPYEWRTLDYYKGTSKPVDGAEEALAGMSKSMKYLYALGRLWSDVRRNFVFIDSISLDWDSLYIATMPRMMEAKDDREAMRLLQKTIARLNDGHTYIYGINSGKYPAPLSTKRIDGHVYIDEVFDTELLPKGIRRGQEITAINGIPVDEYADRFVKPYISSSTPQWTEHVCYDGTKLMSNETDGETVWTIKDDDRQFDYRYKNNPKNQRANNHDSPLTFSTIDKNIGYLKIKSFDNQTATEIFDSIYPALLGTKALIIDLRGNEGGNSNYADYIIRHFATDTLKSSAWESPMYIPAFESWGMPTKTYRVEPTEISPVADKKIYDRPIVLLVDNGTFSAAEDFIAAFRSIQRGRLIGSRTAGSTGNGVRITLIPEVAFANICSKHDIAADGTDFVGHGFTPDIPIEETYKSYFKDKRDAAISAAIDYLKKGL